MTTSTTTTTTTFDTNDTRMLLVDGLAHRLQEMLPGTECRVMNGATISVTWKIGGPFCSPNPGGFWIGVRFNEDLTTTLRLNLSRADFTRSIRGCELLAWLQSQGLEVEVTG